jgi:hypothetical protein
MTVQHGEITGTEVDALAGRRAALTSEEEAYRNLQPPSCRSEEPLAG